MQPRRTLPFQPQPLSNLNGQSLPKTFQAEVLVMRDYYPFGMEVPGQVYVASEYRYGFNGMERDDEVKGAGDSYTSLYRQLDARIGRWISLDPKPNAWITQYSGFDNNPILYSDPNGDKVKFERGDKVAPKDHRAMKSRIQDMRKNSESFNAMYTDFKGSEKIFVYRSTVDNGGITTEEDGRIVMNIGLNSNDGNGAEATLIGRTAHETGHGYRILFGLDPAHPIWQDVPRYATGKTLTDKLANMRRTSILEHNKIAVSTHSRIYELGAEHIENIVRSELIRSQNVKYSSIGLSESYPAALNARYEMEDGQLVYKEDQDGFRSLEPPRTAEYYLSNKFDIHKDHNVNSIK